MAVVPGSLSIEMLHLPPWKLEQDVADRAALVASRYAGPLLQRRSRLRQPTSSVVLLDDYFLSGSPARLGRILDEAMETLTAAAAQAGLTIDAFVKESAMAEVADQVVSLLGDQVRNGVLLPERPYRRFGIDAVPVWQESAGERRWTCPFLAATWHLVRLGIVELPAGAIAVSDTFVGPRSEDVLTLLSSRYLATEAAVQAVCASLADEDLAEYVLDHSAHLFIPDGSPGEGLDADTGTSVALVSGAAARTLGEWTSAARPSISHDSEPVLLAIDADSPWPYALWELVEIGPGTVGLGQRLIPTPADERAGITAMRAQAAELGYSTLLVAGANELSLDDAGLSTVVRGPEWRIQLAVSPPAPNGHRTQDGEWLTGHNPPSAALPGPWEVAMATVADLDDMGDLDASEYLVPLPGRVLAEAITTGMALVARCQGKVIGSVIARPLVGVSQHVGEVYTIVVDPRYRSCGIGAALLAGLEQLAWLRGWDALWLESSLEYSTRHKGSGAPFYLRYGWTLLAESSRTVYFAKANPARSVAFSPLIES